MIPVPGLPRKFLKALITSALIYSKLVVMSSAA